MSSINDIKDLYTKIKVSETKGTLLSEASYDIGPEHKKAQKTQKLYNKGVRTDNPYEKEQFLKRTGPQLPLAKEKPGMQVAGYEPEGDIVDEGMTLADYKKQKSRQKQKEKRAADKIAPTRRAGIHADKASPERAARHRANVDPDFEGNDERNYPGGKLNPKKVRKAKALGELGERYINVDEAHYNPVTKKVQDKPASREEIESLAAKARTKKKVRKPLGSIRKNSETFKPSSPEESKENKRNWDEYWEGSWKNKEQKEEYVSEAKGMSKDEMSSILKGHKYSKKELLDMSKKSTKEGRHGEAAAFYQEFEKEEYIAEREMTSTETKKEKKLKNKYDTSGMKKSMIDQYGKEKGTQIYFATIRKQAMADSFEQDGEQLDEIVGPLLKLGLAAGGGALAYKGLQHAGKKIHKALDNATNDPKRRLMTGGTVGDLNKARGLSNSYEPEDVDFDDAYAYIIEMLVAADYAEDYAAAEVMFEHMSDEFTSVILEEYIEEKARGTRKKTTVHAYDVDETLFGHGKKGKPNVQVHVKDASGKRVKSLSNQEFNTHKLDKGHSYDFSEFQSAKKFSQTASPNKKVIKDIKRKQARGQNVHLITARSKFDNPSEFQGHLKKHGVDVEKSNIHYTGGMRGGDIGKKKVDVANAVAKKSGAKSIHMYDDAAKVHKAFEKEKKEAPTTKKIKTHMVAPDKSGESRVRSYQATKNEEMSSYEYWKQFINEDSVNEDLATGLAGMAAKRGAAKLGAKVASKFIPGFQQASAVGDTISDIKKGDWGRAALSAGQAIPGPAGWGFTAARMAAGEKAVTKPTATANPTVKPTVKPKPRPTVPAVKPAVAAKPATKNTLSV